LFFDSSLLFSLVQVGEDAGFLPFEDGELVSLPDQFLSGTTRGVRRFSKARSRSRMALKESRRVP
jgi:hypothetical protein